MKNFKKPRLFKTFGLLLAMSILLALTTAVAVAASYPSKPVRLVVPMQPGGSTDTIGRLIASKLSERLGEQVILENRSGAGGIIGTESVAKSDPDGSTLLFAPASYTVNAAIEKLPYDPIKAFTAVAKIGDATNTLVVHPSVPVKTVKELIALAKQKPGYLIFSATGIGALAHISTELFKIMTDIDVKIVQFKGGGPSVIDLLGGHHHAMFGSIVQNLPHITSGKFRVLATCGMKRSVLLPDVPTMNEAGVPGYESGTWWGVLAPAGTPAPVIDRLDKEIKVILASDEVKKRFLNEGAEMDYLGPTEFGPFIAKEIAKWERVVKAAKIVVK